MKTKQIYIVRRYVLATSVKEALKLEKKIEPRDCYLEETSQKAMIEDMIKPSTKKVGFSKK